MGDLFQVEEQVSPDTLCGPFFAYTSSIQNCHTEGVGGHLMLLILIYGPVFCACVGSCSAEI